MPELLEFRYPSARSGHTIYAQELCPDTPPRAVIQIVHGVAEHMGRYEEVSRFLAAHGFLVCGEDHLGHGKTVEDGSYGFFAPKGGWDLVVRDVRRLRELEGEKYPSLPYFLLGHSMGSFLTRTYLIQYPGTLDGVRRARELGFQVRSDFGIGVYNSQTLKELKKLGVEGSTASFELKFAQIRDLSKAIPMEAIVYGQLPLMITENCIIHNHTGRHSCEEGQRLVDRKGEHFPVVKAWGCRNEILNGKTLFLADKAADYQRLGLTSVRLMFTTESPEECVRVLERYLGRGRHKPGEFTRGLYYRDVE